MNLPANISVDTQVSQALLTLNIEAGGQALQATFYRDGGKWLLGNLTVDRQHIDLKIQNLLAVTLLSGIAAVVNQRICGTSVQFSQEKVSTESFPEEDTIQAQLYLGKSLVDTDELLPWVLNEILGWEEPFGACQMPA